MSITTYGEVLTDRLKNSSLGLEKICAIPDSFDTMNHYGLGLFVLMRLFKMQLWSLL